MSDSHIVSLTTDLCQFRTGVVADENEDLFQRIEQELPIQLHRYASGQTYNGWTVPDNWKVQTARIRKDGQLVFDGTSDALALAYYSKSFTGTIDFDELKSRIVTNHEQPDAHVFHCMWQYRPWEVDWAFCIPHNIFKGFAGGTYDVDVKTSYEPGEMLVGVYDHKGTSPRTIVFNAHTCHPHMANDGFVGVATLIRLAQWLESRDTFYSYRFVFGPEHLGTVFYLRDLPEEQVNQFVSGMFVEMTGTDGPIRLASTYLGHQEIDRAVRHAARHHSKAYNEVAWRCGAGNDETVWEAPGYEVPFVEATRCIDQFAPFPQYHTNLDTPESLNVSHVDEFFEVLKQTVHILECNASMTRTFDGLICLSNPEYDLYLERPDPAVKKELQADSEKWGHLLDSLFRYFDGTTTVLDVAVRHDLPFDALHAYLQRFEAKGLIHRNRSVIERHPVFRAARKVDCRPDKNDQAA